MRRERSRSVFYYARNTLESTYTTVCFHSCFAVSIRSNPSASCASNIMYVLSSACEILNKSIGSNAHHPFCICMPKGSDSFFHRQLLIYYQSFLNIIHSTKYPNFTPFLTCLHLSAGLHSFPIYTTYHHIIHYINI